MSKDDFDEALKNSTIARSVTSISYFATLVISDDGWPESFARQQSLVERALWEYHIREFGHSTTPRVGVLSIREDAGSVRIEVVVKS